MHSRIYQVNTKPIESYEYIDKSDYYDHWFTNQIADYVNGDTDREDDIEWLKSCAKGYDVDKDENGYYLIVHSKEEYFTDAFRKFKEALAKIGEPTIEDFIKGIDLWYLNDADEDKYGFYVEWYGHELMPLDRFIRRCVVDQKYYLGGTIDYHY